MLHICKVKATITNRVREARTRAGLSQAQLARQVGVSRQALIAVESGRQVPGTRLALLLAAALESSVDALFALRPDRLPIAGDGRVVLGRVDGSWVAHPAGPGTRADGLGDAGIQPMAELQTLERNILVAGCAPLLGLLAARVPEVRWIPAGSGRALKLLASGKVHVAGLHRPDTASEVRRRFGERMRRVHLTRWRQGLLVRPGNPLGLRSLDDLHSGMAFAGREVGSYAASLVEGRGLSGPVARGHMEVARFVAAGVADAGVAIEAVALQNGLTFVPLTEERFDLVLPPERMQHAAPLLDALTHIGFRSEVACLGGYEIGEAGATA